MKAGNGRRSVADFQAVKLDLGVVLLVCAVVLFLVLGLGLPAWQQVLVLAAVGGLSAAWLMGRVRRLGRRLESSKGKDDGSDQEQ